MSKISETLLRISIALIFIGFDPTSSKGHSRQKRFAYFNTQSPIAVGALFTIPMTFILPTMNLKTSRRRRSYQLDSNPYANQSLPIISEDYLNDIDADLPPGSYDPPAYGVELTILSRYFSALEIDEDECQQKIICQIFANSTAYEPLSGLFLKKLTVDRGPIEEEESNRYFRFIRAMQKGFAGNANCNPKCPYSIEDVLNREMLIVWNYIMNMLKIEIKDDL